MAAASMKLTCKPMCEYAPGEIAQIKSASNDENVVGVVSAVDEKKGFQFCYMKDGQPKVETIKKPRDVRTRVRLIENPDFWVHAPRIFSKCHLQMYDAIYEFRLGDDRIRGRIVDLFGVELKVKDAQDRTYEVTLWDMVGEVKFCRDLVLHNFSAKVAARKHAAAKRHGFVLLGESVPIGSCRLDNNSNERIIPLYDSNPQKMTIYASACELFIKEITKKLRDFGLRCRHPGHLYKYVLIQYWILQHMTLDEGLRDIAKKGVDKDGFVPDDFYICIDGG